MPSICDSYCKGCIYLGKVSQAYMCCRYVFVEDKLRPCPAGTGCTVKQTDKEIKQKAEEAKKALIVERKKRMAEQRAEQQRLRAERKEAERLLRLKPCKNCGKIFLPNKDHRDHCCNECAYQYHLKTENERSKRRWAERREKANGQKRVPKAEG